MTDTERKALELLNEVRAAWGLEPYKDNSLLDAVFVFDALRRAIERHEAFKIEVSDAVEADVKRQIMHHADPMFRTNSVRFIIAKPDPLVEAVKDILNEDSLHEAEEFCEAIRASLANRGLEIREKGE